MFGTIFLSSNLVTLLMATRHKKKTFFLHFLAKELIFFIIAPFQQLIIFLVRSVLPDGIFPNQKSKFG
jgi:hypothetical protein